MKKSEFSIDRIKVFTDFDGTIAKVDIGDELFLEYGEFEPYHTWLINDEISIYDYWKELCRSLKPGVDAETIKNFAEQCEIDPYFLSFSEFCKNEGITLRVVSDGFDSYIAPTLEKAGLGHLDVNCNKMIFLEDGSVEPFFPLADESCKCKCAVCKRNAVISKCEDEDIIVFIGDGYSDFCVAEHSDIVFAKKNLGVYCAKNKIPNYQFNNFFDVKRILEKKIKERTLKQRHQARLLRKTAFEAE